MNKKVGAGLAFVVLFVLFVYPNPEGVIFGLLRMGLLGLALLLFLQLYQKDRRSKPLSSREGTMDVSGEQVESSGGEQQADNPRRVQFIVDTLSEAIPGFGIACYDYRSSESSLMLRKTAGENVGFAKTVSGEAEWVSDFFSSASATFLTPGTDQRLVKSFFEEHAAVSEGTTLLVVPVGNAAAGARALVISADQFGGFQDFHRPLVESFASALAQSDAFAGDGDRREHLSFFRDLEAFQNGLDISRPKEDFMEALGSFCGKNFTFDKLTLIILDPEKPDEAVAAAVVGYRDDFDAETRFRRDESLLWRVLDGKQSHAVDLADGEKAIGRFRVGDTGDHHFFSFIGAPILVDGRPAGCIILESFFSGRYKHVEGRNLRILCARLGVLLDWRQKYETVRETAMHDGLTGLLNHRAFVERFRQELQRAKRYRERLVLLILDLDKFKRINDTHGHLYGDYVLRETAAVLKNCVRNIDIVARYGGEEFTIVLVKAEKGETVQTATRIVRSLADFNFEKDGISVRMTISAGMAEYPVDGEGLRELIAKADRVMYDVKRRGGNDVGFGDE